LRQLHREQLVLLLRRDERDRLSADNLAAGGCGQREEERQGEKDSLDESDTAGQHRQVPGTRNESTV
jgi:hypothetical protein